METLHSTFDLIDVIIDLIDIKLKEQCADVEVLPVGESPYTRVQEEIPNPSNLSIFHYSSVH